MPLTQRVLLVPAAGLGTRLKAAKPKALVEVNGRPMLDHLRHLYRPYVDAMIVVAHSAAAADIERWAAADPLPTRVAEQRKPTGMLDAILLGAPAVLRFEPSSVWITWSDQIGVLAETLERLAESMASEPPPAVALPTVRRNHPYIHFERDATGTISGLAQRREGDRMPDQGESDMGLFALTRHTFERDLPEYARTVMPAGGTGERNFLPFVPWLAARAPVITIAATDAREAIGINTPDELQMMEQWLRSRTA